VGRATCSLLMPMSSNPVDLSKLRHCGNQAALDTLPKRCLQAPLYGGVTLQHIQKTMLQRSTCNNGG
jgi:hypothetical protein